MTDIDNWLLFAVLLGLSLIITFLMIRQGKYFYTMDVALRKFSIMELEVPSTPTELVNLIKGLYNLPPEQSKKSVNALRGQLKLDFLFMPFAYGCIFLLCWRVGHKMQMSLGHIVFIGFALLQVIPWICDIIENIYLLGKIKPGVVETSPKNHHRYLLMEGIKWGISLTAAACSVSAVCYFWLTGAYSFTSIIYLLIVFAEIIVFVVSLYFLLKKKELPIKS